GEKYNRYRRALHHGSFAFRRRNRDHEHHFREREGADERNWNTQSARRASAHDSAPVPDRIDRSLFARRIYRTGGRLFHVLRNRQGFPIVSNSIFLRARGCEHDRVDPYRFDLRFRAGLVGVALRPRHGASLRIEIHMRFSETITMALGSLGVNKLRSGLTMFGITIGVFSVISVMTAIGALQYSIENGLSFLGSNIFQFAKYPANVSAGGNIKKKYQNRRNITYQQALHYQKLM